MTLPTHSRSSGLETSLRCPSLADYTIDTHESEFSEATPGIAGNLRAKTGSIQAASTTCFRHVGTCAVRFQESHPMSRTRLFSRQAWDKNASIYDAIRTMPFTAQLASGTLSDAGFKHYLTQDPHSLIRFAPPFPLAPPTPPNPTRISPSPH